MTKIIVDKLTALRAICKYFDIPLFGTEPSYHKGVFRPTNDIEIEFDFDKENQKGVK